MSERTVREVYTKEVRRRNFDDYNRFIDVNISRGKAGIPVTRETEKSSNDLRDVKKSVDALHQMVAAELERKKWKEARTIYSPAAKPFSPVPTIEVVAARSDELREIRQSVDALHQLVAAEKQREPKQANPAVRKASDLTEMRKSMDALHLMVSEKLNEKADSAVDIQQESAKVSPQLTEILETQKAIQKQLEEQKELLAKMETERKDSDRQLRDDVGDALREQKDDTDAAVQELARKVSDLISDNEQLKGKLDQLSRTIEDLYETDEESARGESPQKEMPVHRASHGILKVDFQPAPEVAHHPLVAPKAESTSSSSSTTESGSVAVELPPVSVTDGRRPSQAVLFNASTKTARRLNPSEDNFAEETAKKALADATRIETARL